MLSFAKYSLSVSTNLISASYQFIQASYKFITSFRGKIIITIGSFAAYCNSVSAGVVVQDSCLPSELTTGFLSLSQQVCLAEQNLLSQYYIISTAPFLDDAWFFHFPEIHGQQHVFTNAKVMASLTRTKGVVFLENVEPSPSEPCDQLTMDMYGGYSNLNAKHKGYKKLFPSISKQLLVCTGWEDMKTRHQIDSTMSINSESYFDIMARFNNQVQNIVDAIEKIRNSKTKLYLLLSQELVPSRVTNSLHEYRNLLLKTYQQFFPKKFAETESTLNKVIKKIISFITNSESLSDKMLPFIMELDNIFKVLTIDLEKEALAIRKNQDAVTTKITGKVAQNQQTIIKERNDKGLIKALSKFGSRPKIQVFSTAGIFHSIPVRSVQGEAALDDINSNDVQYSLRKFLQSVPSAILVHEDIVNHTRKKIK
jgi:hypothetical protein